MTRDEACALDFADPLAFARERFRLPDGLIYLDGNSLGALPAATPGALDHVAQNEWGKDLITSWNRHGWIDAPTRIAAKLAPIVGAKPSELLIADSTSICLFKLLAAAIEEQPGRTTILTERGNFPTDLYVAEGLAALKPQLRLRMVERAELAEAIDDDTAVLYLTHVDYCSGERHDMRALTEAAHASGALVLWDLCHSAGAIAFDLNADGCDLAVGCGYKYLNGGPGSPAFVYAAHKHHAGIVQPLSGWWAHARPFAMERGFAGGEGIRRFQCGTQPMLSLRALKGALDIWDDVDMQALRKKSVALTDLFIELVEARCGKYGVTLETTRDSERRGSQVSFSHANAYEIMQALIERGVIGDFCAPSIMRFGFTPLYTSYRDVWDAVEILKDIFDNGAWQDPRFAVRSAVT